MVEVDNYKNIYMKRKKVKISKLLFIDTNIIINCALEEVDKHNINTLKDIEKNLDKKEIILILPENIKEEVFINIKDRFEKLQKNAEEKFKNLNFDDGRFKTPVSIEEEINKNRDILVEKIKDRHKSVTKIIDKLFKHKNTKIINVTNELVVSGMKRACLMKSPYTSIMSNKTSFLRDKDCIAFEALLNYLKKEKDTKKMRFIICSEDGDYFKSESDLYDEVIREIKEKCKSIVGYKSLFKVLEKELNEKKYSKKKIEPCQNQKSLGGLYELSAEKLTTFSNMKTASMFNGNNKEIKFCPYCGHDIGLFRSMDSLRCYGYTDKQIYYCPYCGKRIEIM